MKQSTLLCIKLLLLLSLIAFLALFNVSLQSTATKLKQYNAKPKEKRSLLPNKVRSSEPATEEDLRRVFSERRQHLQEGCHRMNVTKLFRPKAWLTFLTAEAPGPLQVCLPPKAGSSSWAELNKQLNLQKLSHPHPATAVLVRHPLSRLASAYRDKYLDGAPINEYNDDWRNRTDSPSTWDYNWYDYWLPTLISSGRLKPTEDFLDLIDQYLEVFDFIGENFSYDGKDLIITKENDFEELSKFIATQMIITGRQMGLQNAIMEAYKDRKVNLKARFGNHSFTFKEFLEFVVWSNDLGIMDIHWTPYTELCFPCHQNYQYILHLETIKTESRVLLHDVGYSEDVKLITKHKTKGLTYKLHKNDIQYYENIPKSLMDKILKIYEYDFNLFGYSKTNFSR